MEEDRGSSWDLFEENARDHGMLTLELNLTPHSSRRGQDLCSFQLMPTTTVWGCKGIIIVYLCLESDGVWITNKEVPGWESL